jgi:hypothetical protein
MKLLQLHVEFKLPDDFEGSMPDALRLLAAYWDSSEACAREAMNKDHPVWLSSKDPTIGDWEMNALQRLIDKHELNGSRIVSCHYLGEWDESCLKQK